MEALPNEDGQFWLVTSSGAAELLEDHVPYLQGLRQAWRRMWDRGVGECQGAEVAKGLQGMEREDLQIWEGRLEYRSRKETEQVEKSV